MRIEDLVCSSSGGAVAQLCCVTKAKWQERTFEWWRRGTVARGHYCAGALRRGGTVARGTVGRGRRGSMSRCAGELGNLGVIGP